MSIGSRNLGGLRRDSECRMMVLGTLVIHDSHRNVEMITVTNMHSKCSLWCCLPQLNAAIKPRKFVETVEAAVKLNVDPRKVG